MPKEDLPDTSALRNKKEPHLPPLPSKVDYLLGRDEPPANDIGYSIQDSNTIKSQEILAQVISARVSFLQNTIDEINAQLRERQGLKEQLRQDIDEKLCQTQTTIYELEQELSGKIDKSRRRISLERQIADLEKEKRQQELLHWQDTVMLKRELREAEKELHSALLDWWMVRRLEWF